MLVIDLDRIRKALPKRATVKPIKYRGKSPAIECFTGNPSLTEEEWEMCIQFQREIIGEENILEFYSEEMHRHWYVFLKRQPMELANATDEDVNSFMGMELVKDGVLASGSTEG